ncbi:homoserine dehydrogenase [Brevibacterium zhoupengii]|uniref:homoserine dehydrogenase n=1 Tax=Brevibacterium zhoupengii TaxID=2898795 RepID=UPI001E29C8C0|nr:homoserine dehydrogenase [Brevibacterium zhoupengii]
MNTYDLALVGFGGVNQALARLIVDGPERFDRLGFRLRIVGISDLFRGTLVNPNGIDLASVFRLGPGESFSILAGGDDSIDNERFIRQSTAQIVVEATFTNPLDGEPAATHVRTALESGKHVTTTNKGPVALYGRELNTLAEENGVLFAYEGSVVSGTPVISLAHERLSGATIRGVQGILNGTCNYVLGRMEDGLDLEAAISEAQGHGYAEADPTADIGGSDVQLKVSILANELLDANLDPSDVDTTGIDAITRGDIETAAAEGKKWKLIGSVSRSEAGTLVARVQPVALSADHPLAGIAGATNAVTFDTDLLGQVTISGPGAGRVETAYALVSDIISIHDFKRETPNA